MELVQLYNQKHSVHHIEELIERNLVSITVDKVRSRFFSIVLTLNDSMDAMRAGKFLVLELNDLVSKKLVHHLRVQSKSHPYSKRKTTYTLIKPFVSKSSEAGKDTFIYYEPDKSTTTVKLVATGVHKQFHT